MRDGKTTRWGIVAFAGLILTGVARLVGGVEVDDQTAGIVLQIIGTLAAAAGVGGLGLAAKDAR